MLDVGKFDALCQHTLPDLLSTDRASCPRGSGSDHGIWWTTFGFRRLCSPGR
jgi:hypothetical protein